MNGNEREEVPFPLRTFNCCGLSCDWSEMMEGDEEKEPMVMAFVDANGCELIGASLPSLCPAGTIELDSFSSPITDATTLVCKVDEKPSPLRPVLGASENNFVNFN